MKYLARFLTPEISTDTGGVVPTEPTKPPIQPEVSSEYATKAPYRTYETAVTVIEELEDRGFYVSPDVASHPLVALHAKALETVLKHVSAIERPEPAEVNRHPITVDQPDPFAALTRLTRTPWGTTCWSDPTEPSIELFGPPPDGTAAEPPAWFAGSVTQPMRPRD